MNKFIKPLFALIFTVSLFSEIPASAQPSYKVRLEVADKRVPCRRTVQCLLVRDGRSMTEWTPLYTEIRDFDFRENYSYSLLVRATPVKNPPADAPPVNYRLERVLSRKRTNGAVALEYLDRQNPRSTNMTLEGRKWILAAIGERAVGETRAYLEFSAKDMRFGGNSGCNRISGGYTHDSAELKFGAALATKMFCGGDAGEIEKSVFAALEKVTRHAIVGNKLMLYAGDESVLTFTGQDPKDAA